MIMNVSKEDRRCLLLAVTDWIDNVAQEDTDKDEYINMVRLQKRLSTIPRVTQLTICFCGHTRGVHTRAGQHCDTFDCNCPGFAAYAQREETL